MKILDCWPDPSKKPRVIQHKFFEWITEQDARFIIAQVPTGGGKSLLGMTLSRWFNKNPKQGNSYILTPQRILQSQYEQDFTPLGLCSLYGRGNFECSKVHASCEVGHLVKPACTDCGYEARKAYAKKAPDVVLNYKIALLLFGYTQVFEPRPLIILDEAHTAENHLVEFNTVYISALRLKRLMVSWRKLNTINQAIDWIKEKYVPKLTNHVDALESIVYPLLNHVNNKLTADEIGAIKEWASYKEHLDLLVGSERGLLLNSSKWIDENYVYICDDHSLQFKRLYAKEAFSRIILPYADRFLFMSSTILNYEGFCSDLNINPDEAVFFDVGSEFPPKHRTVAYIPKARMSYGWDQDKNAISRRKMVNEVYNILQRHKDESGIIHTGSFKIAKWLLDDLGDDITHKVFHHNKLNDDDSVNRNDTINDFIACEEPAILISPSSTEGLDLKDDLARFAIFVKVPFGSLQDEWIKRRMTLSKEWYQRQALTNIIQGGGRIVRSKDDWGIVYILDESWEYLFRQTYRMIPRWWLDAYNK